LFSDERKRAGSMAQMIQCLPSKSETLRSNPSTRQDRGRREKDRGWTLIKEYYMQVWKYHNETPFYN
jgi:hypothetical protein